MINIFIRNYINQHGYYVMVTYDVFQAYGFESHYPYNS